MSVIRELQQRNVIRVGAAYLALSWLLIQVIDTLGPDFGLPDNSLRMTTIVLMIALLPVLIFTWSFEVTAEGIKRDRDVDHDSAARLSAAKRLDRLVIVILALAVGYFAFDKFVLAPEREAEIAAEALDTGRIEGLVGSFGKESIAVLPFDDMSEGGDQAWFADGISEELLNLLAKVEGLRVTSRSSSFAFRGQGLSIPDIAKRLGVRYVLEGSVRKAGNTIRVTAQLIEGGADAHIWSETYDRKFDNVFAIQDEISATVVDELKVTILGDLPTADVTGEEAYELYLEGLPLLAERGDDLVRAEEIFKRVIELDPGYAPAHASYAASLFWQAGADENNKEIIAAAKRALDIDPRNVDALALLGRKYIDTDRPAEGEALLRRAIEVNPSHANAWRWLGTLHTDSDPEAYLRYTQRAFELNPTELTIRYHTGLALALLRRYGEAKKEFELMAGSGPKQMAIAMAALTDYMAGRLDRSLKGKFLEYREFGASVGTVMIMRWLGEYDLGERWLQEQKATYGSDYENVIYAEAFGMFIRDDRDGALALIIDAAESGHLAPGYPHVGMFSLIVDGDMDLAVADFERVLPESGQDAPTYLGYDWAAPLYYGIALYRRGDIERAGPMLAEIEEQLKYLLGQGVVVDQHRFRLHESLAHLYVTRGDYDEAIKTLRRGVAESFLCPPCLKKDSYFEPLRDRPDFQQILADADRWAAEHRDRLAAEGLLLTPEEVRALESFEFDPFDL
jgi:TolB-like protein/cytochrome c-type biogenesis protein CcmH/NrfG